MTYGLPVEVVRGSLSLHATRSPCSASTGFERVSGFSFRIFFAGKYINNHAFTMESITHGVNFYMRQYDLLPKGIQRTTTTFDTRPFSREEPPITQAGSIPHEDRGTWVPSVRPNYQNGARAAQRSSGSGRSDEPARLRPAGLTPCGQLHPAVRAGERHTEESCQHGQSQVEHWSVGVASSIRHASEEEGSSQRDDPTHAERGKAVTNEVCALPRLSGLVHAGEGDGKLTAASDPDSRFFSVGRDSAQGGFRGTAQLGPRQTGSLGVADGEMGKDQVAEESLQEQFVCGALGGRNKAPVHAPGSPRWAPPHRKTGQKLAERHEAARAPQPPPFEVSVPENHFDNTCFGVSGPGKGLKKGQLYIPVIFLRGVVRPPHSTERHA